MAPPRKVSPSAPKRVPVSTTRKNPGLSLRDLNRATLARQLLLTREKLKVPAAIERVAGLQAQLAVPPYVGLWSRLSSFKRDDLVNAFEDHSVVRAPFLRGTLHAVTSTDYLRFRSVLTSVFAGAIQGMPEERLEGIDAPALAAEARPFLEEAPRTQDEVRNFLAARHPKLDVRMMGHVVRMHLPLVQVPEADAGPWRFPSMPRFALSDSWIGKPVAKNNAPDELIRHYLAAFGPANARDFQTWSALPAMRDAFERLRPELQMVHDEAGRELFDLQNAPLPGGDAPAPPRFLPEFDNILLAHTDRTRVVADEHRKQVFLPGLRVAATILIDGFVAGTWKCERSKKDATVVVSAFATLPKKTREALESEGEELAQFLNPDAKSIAVKFS
jgi:hypothetical protein